MEMDTPSSKRGKAMDAGDSISGLPDEMRRHILSFLPARDAVRTSVLSPKWRHLWASVRRLNVNAEGFTSKRKFVKFVNALLLSRDCIPLESFWLRANGADTFLENVRDTVYLWIRHALRSNVDELGVIDHDFNDIPDNVDDPEFFQLEHCPFTSSYLKKLHLCYVNINNRFITRLFYGCPALEDLEMINRLMFHTEFTSATLKSLSIDYVHFPNAGDYGGWCHDIVINMPSLVSLHIGKLLGGVTLSLVDMQSLATASIYLEDTSFSEGCTFLGALSNVTTLELLFPYGYREYQLQRSDMKLFQVTFANLTTLSLSDWCLNDNCKALLYVLEHSPNLEELTLEMTELCFRDCHHWFHSASAVESPCQEIAAAFKCEKLKKVEIVCPEGDKSVGKLVTILLTKIISPPEICIKPLRNYSMARDFSNCCS